MLPALAMVGVFVILPLAAGAVLSFFKWDGINQPVWHGLDGYIQVFASPALRDTLVHAFILIGFYGLLPISIGLVLATVVRRSRVRGLPLYRTAIFLPQVVPTVAAAVVWRWLYQDAGPINSTLRSLGLDALAIQWLGDFTWTLGAVGLVGTWASFGLCTVLFLSAIQRIPEELYDAAKVDGAGAVQEFFAITLPALRGEIAVALTLTAVIALRGFDLVYVLTRGGPAATSMVPGVAIYIRAFEQGQIGNSTALGICLALVVAIVVFLLRAVGERGQELGYE
jgi:raffinose/stachyose/melibiose transport system permease protein